jgi:hypothetical protein
MSNGFLVFQKETKTRRITFLSLASFIVSKNDTKFMWLFYITCVFPDFFFSFAAAFSPPFLDDAGH